MFGTYVGILVLLVTIFISILVLLRNIKNSINISFAGIGASMVLWLITNILADFSSTVSGELFWSRTTLLGALFIASFLLLFSIYFPIEKPKINKIFKLVLFLPPLFFLPYLLSNSNLSVNIVDGNIAEMIPGQLYIYFQIYFILYSILALSMLLYKRYKSKGIVREQIKLMFFGVFLTAVIALSILGISLMLGKIVGSSIIPSSLIFFLSFTAYAIVKHKMMDIRMVVARSVAYSILVFSMAAIYAGGVFGFERILFPGQNTLNLGQMAVRTTLAVLMAFSFQPLKRWITRITDKIFFKNQYDPEALLDTFAHTIGSTIVLIEMMYKILELLQREMKITRGVLVVLTDVGEIYNSQTIGYKEAIKLEEADIVKLAKDGILISDELEDSSHYKKLLKKYNVSVSVPIKTNADTVGVLLLGEKQSGDMYSGSDHKIFEIIAPEMAVAITNAKSFEKIEKFNVTLRQEIKKATHELEKKNSQLRELDKAKDEFISMASHQLRTPLTAIKGYLSMLLEGDAGEIKVSQYDFVNEAFSGANRMVGLINDLLNVSRMETGRFFIEPVEIDMERVAGEEVKQLQNHAKEKKLKLSLVIKGKTPHVWADETKIRQVMMNFIDNAVYYTTEGSATITLEHDKENVIFKVTDTGIGVPKAQQANLFTKFYRADNARHVRPDGTGLGIYLAKRVMDDHGGELIFHSEEGKGSVFGFKLPIKSKLKIKRASAPAPTPGSPTTPAIGELAAGIGVSPSVLENTKAEIGATVTPGSPIATGDVIATKAAGIETPLPDSVDKKDLEQTAKELKVKS